MNFSQNDLKIFTEMIRTIVKQELTKTLANVEVCVTGTVTLSKDNNKYDVALAGNQGTYSSLPNKTGGVLNSGDVVTIKAKGGNFGNGYIAFKNGIQ